MVILSLLLYYRPQNRSDSYLQLKQNRTEPLLFQELVDKEPLQKENVSTDDLHNRIFKEN